MTNLFLADTTVMTRSKLSEEQKTVFRQELKSSLEQGQEGGSVAPVRWAHGEEVQREYYRAGPCRRGARELPGLLDPHPAIPGLTDAAEVEQHSQNTLTILSKHSHNTLKTLSQHSQNTLKTLSQHSHNTLTTLSQQLEHSHPLSLWVISQLVVADLQISKSPIGPTRKSG